MNEPKYCKNCLYWCNQTNKDTCFFPTPRPDNAEKFYKAMGITNLTPDITKIEWLKSRGIHPCDFYAESHGHPSLMNYDNQCIYYKGLPKYLRWFTPLFRFLF